MANPLKLLKLKATGFQFIQELPVDAPPARVWAALMNFPGWFAVDRGGPRSRMTLEPRVGGEFISHRPDGVSMLHMVINYFEPPKLLRLSGPMGLSHLPVNNVFIFELQPKRDGRSTLLRLCQRTFGYVTPDIQRNYKSGWKVLLPQLKALAEGEGVDREGAKARRTKTKSR